MLLVKQIADALLELFHGCEFIGEALPSFEQLSALSSIAIAGAIVRAAANPPLCLFKRSFQLVEQALTKLFELQKAAASAISRLFIDQPPLEEKSQSCEKRCGHQLA